MSKQRNREQNFKAVKILAMFFRFFGCAISAYFTFQSVLQFFTSYEKNQTIGVVIFIILSVFFLYLTIFLGRQAIQASKAKKIAELP
ncbi:hypothetical protein KO561_02645 [Radiobacillus kanasensis]|uniref:hypothetical protein n=1 Tax=Radiobacillus kanasensis TaxID=2844358 RepID=UPI001E5F1ED0|nr:hypothetical protein [Radiobacillus kanasensis]UFT99879.1 hypothetical protein KO561_02645 [Radiobacillus kanasensis]